MDAATGDGVQGVEWRQSIAYIIAIVDRGARFAGVNVECSRKWRSPFADRELGCDQLTGIDSRYACFFTP